MRASGILMHITSLPGPYGVGTMGKEAFRFVDFLEEAGQSYWQILPLNPTGYGDSPYQSCSTFAGNHYLIDLDTLVEEGLLKKEELENIQWFHSEVKADFGILYNNRLNVLRKAFARFKGGAAFDTFCKKNSSWLPDFCLFMALKGKFAGKPWYQWDEKLKFRDADAISVAQKELQEEIRFFSFVQYLFDRQWTALRSYANDNGIRIIGDVPIYVPYDSVEVWKEPELFQLDKKLDPVAVAGCPPDAFTEDGQLWGNPLYRWEDMAKDGYAWWLRRLEAAGTRYDVIRVDHFRGFEAYWAVPFGDKTARGGKWVKGPGMKFITAVKEGLPQLNLIAEDLGFLTQEVLDLRDESGFPGMKVLQFAFDPSSESDYLPHRYIANTICYTGTHDNMTMRQWFDTCDQQTLTYAREYMNLTDERDYVWGTIRTAFASPSDLCVVQMQDFLGIGAEGRMNFPGTLSDSNWTWRTKYGTINDVLAKKIRNLTRIYCRLGNQNKAKEKNTLRIGEKRMNYNCMEILKATEAQLRLFHDVSLQEANPQDLHEALGKAVMIAITDNWSNSRKLRMHERKAFYISAEYLIGRLVYSNLYNLGILEELKQVFAERGVDLAVLEDIEDDALGNGGLGRLAACFLDSAASCNLPLSGYGLRYKFGLFKQRFDSNGSQVENADDWTKFGDPWSYRRYNHTVKVKFPEHTVLAVPYDVPVIGYGTDNVGTLRLWQCEAEEELDFNAFNDQDYMRALNAKNKAEDITRVLYPNDSTWEGKRLRLKQQYVLSSASLQDMLRTFKLAHGNDLSRFGEFYAVQLNDTHPAMSIPELIRLLMLEGMSFDEAFAVAQKTFSYTNHTVLGEALEKWPLNLMRSVVPQIADIICKIDHKMRTEIPMDFKERREKKLFIIDEDIVHMANLSIYVGSYVNGVAEIHSQILKDDCFKEWYHVFPERFQNKTNGITPRRWIGLCNPELSSMIRRKVGGDFVKDLELIAGLKEHIDQETIQEFNAIKRTKKEQLCNVIAQKEGVMLNPEFMFDVQVKRLHMYKRQLMNIVAVVDIYFRLKEGRLPDFQPTAFIFGAKAAPGYIDAKAVIRYINRVANMINNDPEVADKMKVVFVQNYNCSYAEHIIPAADISEQISPAGLEASGTGNMKLMLNGAVTLGTLDGANVEIAQEAGAENEYIFGATVEQINAIKGSYNPRKIYDENYDLRRALNTLVDGTVKTDDGLSNLFNQLVNGGDQYYLLLDYASYVDAKLRANHEYADRMEFGRKCLMNIASAAKFSSDRTIRQYAEEIWHIQPTEY